MNHDAGADAAKRCDPAKPFGAPQLLSELSTTSRNAGLVLSPDERTAYFASIRDGGGGLLDLYAASRPSVGAAFENPVRIPNVSSADDDYDPAISGDGLLLVFTSTRNGYRLWKATRTTTTADFEAPTELTALNGVGGTGSPFLSQRGDTLYFVGPGSAGSTDIVRSVMSGGVFGTAIDVEGVNTSFTESSPTLTPDELVIYWASQRTPTKGGFDIWVATRSDVKAPFTGARPVDELNTAIGDWPSFITSDLCTLYIDSNNQIFVATKTP